MKTKSRFPDKYIPDYREKIGKDIRSLTISKIETGKFAITIDYLAKFAWYLDFDIAFVYKKK
ncbi:MAG: hypothetical protein EOO43_27225 [Flavobacterium sp.]|nr:MAG: hypothetical protein EOO43_27225 [Flavobacterium sp.]